MASHDAALLFCLQSFDRVTGKQYNGWGLVTEEPQPLRTTAAQATACLQAGADAEDADEAVGVTGVQGLAIGRPGQGHAVGHGGALAERLLEVGAQVLDLGRGGAGRPVSVCACSMEVSLTMADS